MAGFCNSETLEDISYPQTVGEISSRLVLVRLPMSPGLFLLVRGLPALKAEMRSDGRFQMIGAVYELETGEVSVLP